MTKHDGLAASGAVLAAALFLSLLAGGTAAARADWLVLSSGETVETKGPWRVEGRIVIFTSTRGVLSSVRASSVDIASSRALTVKAREEGERVVVAEPAPRREPVLVLTDADFASAPRPAAGEAGSGTTAAVGGIGDTEAAGAGAAAAPREPIVVPAADQLETRVARQLPGAPSLRIMNWSARPTGVEELSILGYVQNVGKLVSAAVSITVTLLGSEGEPIGSSEAALSSTALMPDVQAFFEAEFPGNPNFASLEFAVSTVELEVGREAGDGEDELELDAAEGGANGADRLPEAPVREAPQGAAPRVP